VYPWIGWIYGSRVPGRVGAATAPSLSWILSSCFVAVAASTPTTPWSSAGIRCRQAPEAGLADAGLVVADGRRGGFPSTLSIGSGGVATRTSSGVFPADVPQRKQSRRARRVWIEVHKAAVSARVFLRVLVSGLHILPLRRLRRRRLQEVHDGVLHRDLQGIFVIFYFRKVFCAKCQHS
jgi:hypothetical protein